MQGSCSLYILGTPQKRNVFKHKSGLSPQDFSDLRDDKMRRNVPCTSCKGVMVRAAAFTVALIVAIILTVIIVIVFTIVVIIKISSAHDIHLLGSM